MDAVELLNLDDAATDLLLASPKAFEARYRVALGSHGRLAAEVALRTRMAVAPRAVDPCWWGYLGVHASGRLVLGTCGFKGAPGPEGEVEIAYFTFPGLEGQGIATAMARALLRVAFASQAVRSVVAHTLPEANASTRVLARLGFSFVGPRLDPEDGRVWRWWMVRSAWREA